MRAGLIFFLSFVVVVELRELCSVECYCCDTFGIEVSDKAQAGRRYQGYCGGWQRKELLSKLTM